MFTTVTLTGTFHNQKGEPGAGTLTFTLTRPMQNGDIVVPAQPVSVGLNGEGKFTVGLLANDDPATVPQGAQYGVTEQIENAQPRDYFIIISHSEATVDISTLMPGEMGWA